MLYFFTGYDAITWWHCQLIEKWRDPHCAINIVMIILSRSREGCSKLLQWIGIANMAEAEIPTRLSTTILASFPALPMGLRLGTKHYVIKPYMAAI